MRAQNIDRPQMQGQLLPRERQHLYEWVLKAKPKIVLEVGTWKGGGSTWQIANAIRDVGVGGHLTTCEVNEDFYTEAQKIFDNDEWRPHVTCLLKPSAEVIPTLNPDFTFFDGPNNADLSLSDFQLLETRINSGAMFACHDWDKIEHQDGNRIVVAKKCVKLRPYLEKHDGWRILQTLTQPISVGLVLAQKK